LRELPPVADENVYRLDDERALVTAVDLFTPIVDDGFDYGRIAAVNALGGVYAMGARPLCAVAIGAFPEDLDGDVVASVFRGGAEKCAEAGVGIVGAHAVKDVEPKYGLCVTGIVHPQRIVRNDSLRAGDVLILTKALGTGILAAARYEDLIGDDELESAIESMLELDAAPSEAALRHGVHAMTHVDGDGLIGRLQAMLGQELGASIDAGTVPLFPRALALAAHDAIPNGTRDNIRDARAAGTRFAADLPPGLAALLCDMQTSGGLLIAVPPDRADVLLDDLRERAYASRAIGTLTAHRGIEVVWRPSKQ
jgi:selenide, water dikinase